MSRLTQGGKRTDHKNCILAEKGSKLATAKSNRHTFLHTDITLDMWRVRKKAGSLQFIMSKHRQFYLTLPGKRYQIVSPK